MPKKDERPVVIIQTDLTPLTLEEYARRYNQTLAAVRQQAFHQQIPTIQKCKGGKVYVNIAQMVASSFEAAGWDVSLPQEFY
ncbi:hypothetical protein RJD39_00095 [Vibrio scophthalmi]|uniref:hypothetical protein n=1 Tax=Vibrio scophthalmi TaxID=45658 RepID=UPI003872F382